MITRYEQLIQGSPDGIMVHDGERVVEVNSTMLRLTGAHTAAELIGRPVALLLDRPYLRAVEEQLLNRAPDDGILVSQDRLHGLDGQLRDGKCWPSCSWRTACRWRTWRCGTSPRASWPIRSCSNRLNRPD